MNAPAPYIAESFADFLRWGFDNARAFRRAESILARYGFADSTWRNDLCPSLTRDPGDGGEVSRLWIDWRDPAGRETPESDLCGLSVETADDDSVDYVPFRSVAYAVRYIRRNYAPAKLES